MRAPGRFFLSWSEFPRGRSGRTRVHRVELVGPQHRRLTAAAVTVLVLPWYLSDLSIELPLLAVPST